MSINKNISRLFLVAMFIFLYFPILYLVFYSFNAGDTMNNFDGISLQWYQELLSDRRLMDIIINTFLVALISSLISTIIGVFGALTIFNIKSNKQRTFVESLNSILLVSPDVIIGISFLLMFTFVSIPLGFISVILAHIAFSVPVVVIMVLPKLDTMDYNLINAAKDLGASNRDIYNKVIFPLITPGILAGFLTAFTYSLDDFAVTFFVTGNGFNTLSVDIYATARQGISLEINALSTIIFVATVAFAIAYYLYETKRGGNV